MNLRRLLGPSLYLVFCIASFIFASTAHAQTQTNPSPWVYQTKSYSNYQFLSGYGGTISSGGVLNDVLQSDDFGFTPTPGNYTVTLTSATFDDKGYIGGLWTNKPGSSCGAPATYSPLPVNLSATVAGHRLQVNVSAYDNCPKNIGWQNVTITWAARSSIMPCMLSVSPTVVSPGGIVNVTGAGFSAFNNTVKASNISGDYEPLSFTNLASPNSTLLSFTVPADAYPGTYLVEVPTQPGCTDSATLQVKNKTSAPSNLHASLDKTGKIALTWIDNATNAIDFDIQRATDDPPADFASFASTQGRVTTYSYDLGSTELTESAKQAYRVRAHLSDGTYTDFSNVSQIPNCALISGSGSANSIKFVFMRGTSLMKDADANYLAEVNDSITNGFAAIEPYKSYISNFSFYVDFTQYDDSIFEQDNVIVGNSGINAINQLKKISACGADAKNYILFVSKSVKMVPSAYSFPGKGFSVDNISDNAKANEGDIDQAVVTVHESGHSFAGLLDEYLYNPFDSTDANNGDPEQIVQNINKENDFNTSKNCTTSPFNDYLGIDSHRVYGSVTDEGCSFMKSSKFATSTGYNAQLLKFYRPSSNAIMNRNNDATLPNYNQFNVIDCGYIIAAIKGANPLTDSRADAAPYWEDCYKMALRGAVTADGIPPANPTAIASKVSDKTLSPGTAPTTASISKLSNKAAPANVTVTGSNFSPMNNAVRLSNVLSSSVYYDISDLSSPDGKTLTFSVPDNIPVGKYNLQVGAFNSDWSKPIVVTILAAGTPPPKGSPAPSPAIPPLYDFGGMYGGNSTNINPATGALSCPTGYGSVLVYDAYKKGGNAAYNLYICVRPHVAGQDPLYDFGGIYETASFIGAPHDDNVATGKMTCPSGFSAAQVVGGNAPTDGSWNFCYSPYSNGYHYYNFGGMYGTNANIVTGAKTCPFGYTALTLTAFPVTYCYQPMYAPLTPPVLKATALSGSQIQLTWTISGTQGLNSYTLHNYSTGMTNLDSNGDTILNIDTDNISPSSTSVIISNLQPKTQTCYSLKANAFYNVKESNVSCATTLAAKIAPVSPTDLSKTPAPTTAPSSPPSVSTITGVTRLTAGIESTWSFSATDPQNSSMTYGIRWGDGNAQSNSTAPSFRHTYTTAGIYTITASAQNAAGLIGQNSLQVVVSSPTTAPATQTPVNASSATYTNTSSATYTNTSSAAYSGPVISTAAAADAFTRWLRSIFSW